MAAEPIPPLLRKTGTITVDYTARRRDSCQTVTYHALLLQFGHGGSSVWGSCSIIHCDSPTHPVTCWHYKELVYRASHLRKMGGISMARVLDFIASQRVWLSPLLLSLLLLGGLMLLVTSPIEIPFLYQ